MPIISGMAIIDDISKAARELKPEQIRERLQQMEQEARVLRALLRATTRVSKPRKTGESK